MLINITRLLFILCTASPSFAATGSNLGQYATNFSPAVLTGQVTDSTGNPVNGATVSTVAGHSTMTNAGGHYTLNIGAPGIYTVTAASGAATATNTTEVSLGTTTTLNPIFSVTIPTLPQWRILLLTLALLTLATWQLAGQHGLASSSPSGFSLPLSPQSRWPSSLLLGQIVATAGLLVYAMAGGQFVGHDGLGTFMAGLLLGSMIEAVRRHRDLE
jgi:hypothetical protein